MPVADVDHGKDAATAMTNPSAIANSFVDLNDGLIAKLAMFLPCGVIVSE
jgi:hypothetical protein